MDYAATLGHMFRRSAAGMRPGTELTAQLLARLGAPDRAVPTVLVAGTNGKGSTSYLLARALQGLGLSVGLYSSPHLLRFVERIQLSGQPLAEDELVDLYQQLCSVEPFLDRPFTFFEGATAMAMLAFSNHKVDLAIIEVGLGGLHDATNALAPNMRQACCVTQVALDHQSTLGNTLTAIAAQKAGIFVTGVPAILAHQPGDIEHVLVDAAQVVGAPVHIAAPAYGPQQMPPYLQRNAAVCRTALEQLIPTSLNRIDEALNAALANFAWPGRYQKIEPWGAAGPTVLLDSGHNPAGSRALAEALRNDASVQGRALHGIVSAMQDKDLAAMVAVLRPRLTSLRLCQVNSPRSRSLEELINFAPAAHLHDTLSAALTQAKSTCAQTDLIVITGSIYLVGEALHLLTGAPCDPPVNG